MPIGTSDGEYYDDPLAHSIGIAEGGTPAGSKERLYVSPSKPESDTAARMGSSGWEKLAGELKPEEGTGTPGKGSQQELPDVTNERRHDFLERMFIDAGNAIGSIGRGETSMWALDQTTGEFHTSPEGIEAAGKLTPFVMTGAISPTIHLRGEGYDALNQGHDVFQEFLAGRGHEGAEGYTPHYPTSEEAVPHSQESVQEPFDPSQWDRDYALRAGHTPEEAETYVRERAEERTRALDEGRTAAEHYVSLHQQGRQREAISFSRNFENNASGEAFSRFVDHLNFLEEQRPSFRHTIEHNPNERGFDAEEYRNYNEQLKEAQKGDTIKLIKDKAFTRTSNNHQFQYASKKGTGSLSITERMGGRDLWVNWVGLERHGSGEFVTSPYEEGPQNFGTKDIKSLLDQIKEEFPNAERIGGFRVSGARKYSGSGAANAWMRIRPATVKTYHDPVAEALDRPSRAQEPGMQAVERALRGDQTLEQVRQAAINHLEQRR